mmetsp:Transcript_15368/g.42979  ORF Transcript_15368/g.42979 Transcript_15368/m.42979 type:complete len:95 (+) Transcript_15368:985-1269(+)
MPWAHTCGSAPEGTQSGDRRGQQLCNAHLEWHPAAFISPFEHTLPPPASRGASYYPCNCGSLPLPCGADMSPPLLFTLLDSRRQLPTGDTENGA